MTSRIERQDRSSPISSKPSPISSKSFPLSPKGEKKKGDKKDLVPRKSVLKMVNGFRAVVIGTKSRNQHDYLEKNLVRTPTMLNSMVSCETACSNSRTLIETMNLGNDSFTKEFIGLINAGGITMYDPSIKSSTSRESVINSKRAVFTPLGIQGITMFMMDTISNGKHSADGITSISSETSHKLMIHVDQPSVLNSLRIMAAQNPIISTIDHILKELDMTKFSPKQIFDCFTTISSLYVGAVGSETDFKSDELVLTTKSSIKNGSNPLYLDYAKKYNVPLKSKESKFIIDPEHELIEYEPEIRKFFPEFSALDNDFDLAFPDDLDNDFGECCKDVLLLSEENSLREEEMKMELIKNDQKFAEELDEKLNQKIEIVKPAEKFNIDVQGNQKDLTINISMKFSDVEQFNNAINSIGDLASKFARVRELEDN